MLGFGKNKKKRKYTKRKTESEKSKSKDDKDLKNKDIEKNEEEKKEKKKWGRSERYIVLSTLVMTIVISGLLAASAREWKLPNAPRIGLPDDTFDETFVIESSKKQTVNKEIVDEFKLRTKTLSGIYGFGVRNLEDNVSYGLFDEEIFQAASLIKLPLMTYVYELAEDDRLSLDSIYTITEEDKVAGSGSLQYAEDGEVITIRELVKAMGQQSDNTAFNILVKKVGEEKFEDYIQKIGMTHTSYETNETTVSDILLFYTKLWQKRLVNPLHRDEILGFLTDTIYENYLPAKLPDDVRVAHKYGREIHVINDAGIIYADKPFVMVMLSKGVVEKESDENFADISKMIFDYEISRTN